MILVGLVSLSTVTSDSAGIVEMVNGLAYGGIPYGSVTGMVAKYPGFMRPQINTLQARQFNGFNSVRPNFRTSRLTAVQPQSVKIYNYHRIEY
ncbi:uncharacterized protein LOC128872250 [Hylaeus volcanicus]|uniref:uncharacterized protein LOC128872250 n=1 Tax=Hylaeus volcanicus TaxID=313075 RepID=UPI0023B83310|nr:uncharacterized protein LOC128872250 [Hylaeus volcanicus]